MTRTNRQKKLSRLRKAAKAAQKKPCPTPHRLAYLTATAAQQALAEHWYADPAGTWTSYHCRCGLWHLSDTPRKHGQRWVRDQKPA